MNDEISQAELKAIARFFDVASRQTRQEVAGMLVFKAKEIMDRYVLTVSDVYEKLLFGQANGHTNQTNIYTSQPEPEPRPKNNTKSQESPINDGDPTTEWVVPWATYLLENCRYISEKDAEHLRRMRAARFSNPRSINDVFWIWEIARNKGKLDTVPPEYDPKIYDPSQNGGIR